MITIDCYVFNLQGWYVWHVTCDIIEGRRLRQNTIKRCNHALIVLHIFMGSKQLIYLLEMAPKIIMCFCFKFWPAHCTVLLAQFQTCDSHENIGICDTLIWRIRMIFDYISLPKTNIFPTVLIQTYDQN